MGTLKENSTGVTKKSSFYIPYKKRRSKDISTTRLFIGVRRRCSAFVVTWLNACQKCVQPPETPDWVSREWYALIHTDTHKHTTPFSLKPTCALVLFVATLMFRFPGKKQRKWCCQEEEVISSVNLIQFQFFFLLSIFSWIVQIVKSNWVDLGIRYGCHSK